MYSRLVIEGNAVYEIDEECAKRKQGTRGYGGKRREGRGILTSAQREGEEN